MICVATFFCKLGTWSPEQLRDVAKGSRGGVAEKDWNLGPDPSPRFFFLNASFFRDPVVYQKVS